MSIEDRIKYLTEQSDRYYQHGQSELSDEEFDAERDAVVAILENENPDHPFLKSVGADISSSPWEKVTHEIELGSLEKVNVEEEFVKWKSKRYISECVIQEKLDGISVCLKYENGKFVRGTTRGNGKVGEDITRNVKRMEGVPARIPISNTIYIRGEIVLRHQVFNTLKDFKNPRNAASGIAKKRTKSQSELLTVISYDVLNPMELGVEKESSALTFLEESGFKVVNYKVCTQTSELVDYYNDYIDNTRASLDWDIDGLVIKSNRIKFNDDWKKPKYKIAWKFPHQRKTSVIRDIIAQVSGNHITPVAIFDPVDIAGATISKASLANYSLAQKRNIGIGAKVEISRRNDVIPYVESILVPGEDFQMIEECPLCKSTVEFETNSLGKQLEFIICPNQTCPAKLPRTLKTWVKAHDCKGIGPAIIDTLVSEGIVTSLIDFLYLPYNEESHDEILKLDGMGKSKLKTIIKQIESTLNTTILDFMTAIDIPNNSRGTFEKILAYLETKHERINITTLIEFCKTDQTLNVDGIGAETSASIKKYINENESLIERLISIVSIKDAEVICRKSNILENKVFCFTGSLNSMGRTEAGELVKRMGGKTGSVSKKLTYLVTNDPSGSSSKLKKARALGIEIIDEAKFLAIVGYETENDIILDKQEINPTINDTDSEDEVDIFNL